MAASSEIDANFSYAIPRLRFTPFRTSLHTFPGFISHFSDLTSYLFILNPVQKSDEQESYWTNELFNREAAGETRCRFESVISGLSQEFHNRIINESLQRFLKLCTDSGSSNELYITS